jgi:AcrR family transcriptional regulator
MADAPMPTIKTGHYYRPVRSARGEARRERILEAAIGLFRDQGFHGTTMDDIGAVAGVTGPALYHHFKSKQEILASVFFRIGDQIFDQLNATVMSDIAPEQLLEELVTHYIDVVIANRRGFPLLYVEVRNLSAHDAELTRERRRLFYEHWARAVSLARPDLLPAEAQQAARSVAWVIQGMGFVDPAMGDPQLRVFLKNLVLSAIDAVPGEASRRSPTPQRVHEGQAAQP